MSRWALALALCCIVFGVRFENNTQAMESPKVAAAIASGESYETILRVVDDPQYVNYSTRLIAQDSSLGHRVIVSSTSETYQQLASVRVGDRITATGYISSLSDFQKYRKYEHIVGEFTAQSLSDHQPSTSLVNTATLAIRSRVISGCARLDTEYRGVCEGLLIGERSNISFATYSTFKDSQLTHLIVASGANIAFVLAFLAPLIKKLNYTNRNIATITIALLYCSLTRYEPSMIRASAMVIIPGLFAIRGYQISQLKVFLSTIAVCLCLDPYLIYRVGFWLSVSAVFGLMVIAPKINRYISSQLISQTLGATLAVQPVLWLVFGFSAPLKWWASVIAIAIAAPLTTLGFVIIVGISFLNPQSMLAHCGAALFEIGAYCLITVAKWGASSWSTAFGALVSVVVAVAYTRKVLITRRQSGNHGRKIDITSHLHRW